MMSDSTVINDLDETEVPTSYSSSTPAAATNRPAIKAPGGGTGRRKEAVARVRLTPGTGRWVVNGKALDAQAHQLNDHDVVELAGVKMEFFFKNG